MPVNLRDPELQEKAREARRQKIQEGKEKYRRDFLDRYYWDELARDYKIRMPQWHIGPTPGNMVRYLKILGISTQEYLEISGEKTLRDFRARNPDWPLRAWVGTLLEYKRVSEEIDQQDDRSKGNPGQCESRGD